MSDVPEDRRHVFPEGDVTAECIWCGVKGAALDVPCKARPRHFVSGVTDFDALHKRCVEMGICRAETA